MRTDQWETVQTDREVLEEEASFCADTQQAERVTVETATNQITVQIASRERQSTRRLFWRALPNTRAKAIVGRMQSIDYGGIRGRP